MVAHTRLVLSLSACSLLSACLASSARAEVIYESALFDRVSSGGGAGIDDEHFLGVRFELTETVTTGSIGGHLFRLSNSEGSDVFGAVVRLDSFEDFPDSVDLSTPDVLGAALIPIVSPSSDVSANLQLTLEPGIYGLLFGSGLFGATGKAGAAGLNIPNGDSFPFFTSGGQWANRTFNNITDKRFFLDTETDINNPTVPEPSGLLLAMVGVWLAIRRSHRQGRAGSYRPLPCSTDILTAGGNRPY